MSLLSCSLPVLRPRSYQSIIIHCFSHSTCTRSYQGVATFVFPVVLRPRSYQSVAIHRFPQPTCALEVTKVLLLSCSPSVLRPRSYQSAKVSLFIVFSSRPAPSKLPKCRYFRVPLPSHALEITKESVSIVFPTRLRPSKLANCRYFRVSPSPPTLRPRSYKSQLFMVCCITTDRFFHPTCAFEVTKVSLFPCSLLVSRPQSVHLFLHRFCIKER